MRTSKDPRAACDVDDSPARTWSERWAACAGQAEQTAVLLAEAAQQAAEARLMQRLPQAAFDVAMSLVEHAALPEDLQPYFPVIFSGRGDLDNRWATHVLEDGTKQCRGHSVLRLRGRRRVCIGVTRGWCRS